MQQLLQKQPVAVIKPRLDATAEYVLSGDFMLPEYCPDVAVVLKCVVTPYIHSRRFNGDMLMLDGVAAVRVLYLDEDRRCVRVAEFTQPLNASMRGQSSCEGLPVTVRVAPEYVNCRAVSPRRIEVRGAFLLAAYAAGVEEMALPCDTTEERLCVRRATHRVCVPLVSAEKTLAVNELLSFDSALPPAEQLLGGDCTAMINDCKLLTDKAIVKGQLYLHHLYTDDSLAGTTHTLDFTVPFSLIMDVDGAHDGMLHHAEVSVLTDTEECVAGVGGANTALDFSAKLLVQLCVYDAAEVDCMLDAFHRDYPVKLEKQPLSLRSLCGAFRQAVTVQKRVALPSDNLQEILDVWVMPQQVSGQAQDGRVELTAQMLVCMLMRDVDGVVVYYERPEEWQLDMTQATAYTADTVQAQLSVSGVNYAAVGDALDLRLTVAAAVQLWEETQQDIVQDILLQSDEPYIADTAALRLYYADAGECVWDIAQHCHVSPESICAENGIHEDVMAAKTVLLVPVE